MPIPLPDPPPFPEGSVVAGNVSAHLDLDDTLVVTEPQTP